MKLYKNNIKDSFTKNLILSLWKITIKFAANWSQALQEPRI